MMAHQHPTTSLYIGTLSANVKHALPNEDCLQDEVVSLHMRAASEAVRIKREGQRLIGKNIEYLDNKGLEHLDAVVRKFLDVLCPRVSMKDVKNDAADVMEDDEDGDKTVGVMEGSHDEEEDDEDDSDLGGSGGGDNAQRLFLPSFLSYLYSGSHPSKIEVAGFISRLQGFGLHKSRSQSEINRSISFTPTDLVRSVVGQLKGEL
ncbi:hypothetical protein BGX28_001920 [Mortierella sp. GBA30]|nr:hypothetical protein BGX28_001920 [Mortierella sp. GBA30]